MHLDMSDIKVEFHAFSHPSAYAYTILSVQVPLLRLVAPAVTVRHSHSLRASAAAISESGIRGGAFYMIIRPAILE